jgi:hypothetical protein
MRFFMCSNYADDPIKPFDHNIRGKVRTYYISRLFCHLCFIICWHVFAKRLHLLFMISCIAVWFWPELRRGDMPWCKGEVVPHGLMGKIEEKRKEEQKEIRNR